MPMPILWNGILINLVNAFTDYAYYDLYSTIERVWESCEIQGDTGT